MFNYKFKLFSISLLAIWVILFIKNVDIPIYCGPDSEFVGWNRLITFGNLIALLSLVFIIIAVLGLFRLGHRLKGSPNGLPVRVLEVKDINYSFLNTLATLVTLFSVTLIPIGTFRDFLVFVVLIFIISVCFLKTNLYYCNPIFAALGYRLYSIKADDSINLPDESIAIYHGKLEENKTVIYYHVADNVYFLKEYDNGRAV